jgi:hypothetical protein
LQNTKSPLNVLAACLLIFGEPSFFSCQRPPCRRRLAPRRGPNRRNPLRTNWSSNPPNPPYAHPPKPSTTVMHRSTSRHIDCTGENKEEHGGSTHRRHVDLRRWCSRRGHAGGGGARCSAARLGGRRRGPDLKVSGGGARVATAAARGENGCKN